MNVKLLGHFMSSEVNRVSREKLPRSPFSVSFVVYERFLVQRSVSGTSGSPQNYLCYRFSQSSDLLISMSRRLVRRLRNFNASPTELKIRSATSNDPFGPSTNQLNEIAILTLSPDGNKIITDVIRKRIQDSSWRHMLKCLTVIEYVSLVGSLDFVNWLKENKYLISTLREYNLRNNEDVSRQIRNKAKTIVKLLEDDTLLKEKRSNFHVFRNQMTHPCKRSSLDAYRESKENQYNLRIVTDEVPLEFRRGTRSMEIIRQGDSFDLDSPTSRAGNQVRSILADITEE